MKFAIDGLCNLGLDEETLLAIHAAALEKIKAGGGELKQITSLNVPGLSTGYQVEATAVEMAKSAWYCLQQLNPDVYGNSGHILKRTVGLPIS